MTPSLIILLTVIPAGILVCWSTVELIRCFDSWRHRAAWRQACRNVGYTEAGIAAYERTSMRSPSRIYAAFCALCIPFAIACAFFAIWLVTL